MKTKHSSKLTPTQRVRASVAKKPHSEGGLRAPKEEVELAKALVAAVFKEVESRAPKGETIKCMDSNMFHFIIYAVAEAKKLNLSRGWYIHGPYVPAVDDALVEMGVMDLKYHQTRGTDSTIFEPMVEYVKKRKRKK
jgi:hypothetical protein